MITRRTIRRWDVWHVDPRWNAAAVRAIAPVAVGRTGVTATAALVAPVAIGWTGVAATAALVVPIVIGRDRAAGTTALVTAVVGRSAVVSLIGLTLARTAAGDAAPVIADEQTEWILDRVVVPVDQFVTWRQLRLGGA